MKEIILQKSNFRCRENIYICRSLRRLRRLAVEYVKKNELILTSDERPPFLKGHIFFLLMTKTSIDLTFEIQNLINSIFFHYQVIQCSGMKVTLDYILWIQICCCFEINVIWQLYEHHEKIRFTFGINNS